MFVNLSKLLQTAINAVNGSIIEEGLDPHPPLVLGNQILLAFQKIADLQRLSPSAQEQLQALTAILAETFDFPLVLIEGYQSDPAQLQILAAHGVSLAGVSEPLIYPMQDTLSGTVVSTQKTMVWAEEFSSMSLHQLEGIELFASNFQTVVSLPLMAHQRVVGVLTLAHPAYRPIEPYGVNWLNSIAAPVAALVDDIHQNQSQGQIQDRLKFAALGLRGVIYDLNLAQGQILRTEGLVLLLGYEDADVEFSLKGWLALVHPEDRFRVSSFLEHEIDQHRDFTLTYRVRRHNHQYVALCDRGIVLRDAQGKPTRIIGSLTEVSTSGHSSVSIHPPEQTSVESITPPTHFNTMGNGELGNGELGNGELGNGERIDSTLHLPAPTNTIFDSIQDVIFQTDGDGCWIFLNPAWTRLTGFSVEDSLGKSWHAFIHPDDGPTHGKAFQAILNSKLESPYPQIRHLTKQGGLRWVEVHCQPLFNAAGQGEGVVGTLHDITEHKAKEAELLHSALHDNLTGLPNRALFMDRLQHAYRKNQRQQETGFAVLFLDLDRFKVINDSLGHIAGDELLKAVAERIEHCLRPGDTVSRFGGDEFTLLLPNIGHLRDAIQISDRILHQLSQPFHLLETEVYTSGSIGIVLAQGTDQTPEDLLRNADIALYRAKNNGKGRYELFNPTMHASALEQLELETELRRAVERQELQIGYQPLYSLIDQKLAGFEALLQWDHPKRGILTATDFLTIAAETGLVIPIGGWVLRSACEQLRAWQQQYALPSHVFMSVHLPSQQVEAADFVTQVQQTLTRLELPSHCLMLEVGEGLFAKNKDGEPAISTYQESALFSQNWPEVAEQDPESTASFSDRTYLGSLDHSKTMAKLYQLKEIGIQLCLDGFGRRFSSFGDLSRLPLNSLKIDRSFISEMEMGNNLEIVRSIITLGHKLGLRVIADGIESEPQMAQLQALKCDYGQGDFLTPSSAVDQLGHVLEQPFFVETASMDHSTSPPTLIIRAGTSYSNILLEGGRSWSMGRSIDSTVVLSDRWVSRNHAEIQLLDNGEYYLVDLGSGNGSFVNGQRVTMPVCLKDGDLLTIGRTEMEFQQLGYEIATHLQDPSPKTVLMLQASQYQGDIWREALSSQGISVLSLKADTDLQQWIDLKVKQGESLPDLLLLDMTTLRPNPYSFCRWCHGQYPQLKIILTSGTRTDVPSSERQWAVYQGALDLLSAFPESNLFSNIVTIALKVRSVLDCLEAQAISQQSLASALMSMQSVINRDTMIRPEGFSLDDLK